MVFKMKLKSSDFEHLMHSFTKLKNEMAPTEPDFFKDKLIHAYNRWVIDELNEIFAAPFSDEGTEEALRAFFDNHWALVQGTLLSPTAIPNSDTTLFLCKIAPLICGEKKPIEILCTDIQWDPVIVSYPPLDETIPLEQIIKTHIGVELKKK